MAILGKSAALIAATALILSGCTAADLRGTPASSPEECRADWQQERRAAGAGAVSTANAAAAIATIFVSAAISADRKQAANNRFKTCLARFGVTDIEGYFGEDAEGVASAATDQRAPGRDAFNRPVSSAPSFTSSGACQPGAGVLQGGSGYCVGSTE